MMEDTPALDRHVVIGDENANLIASLEQTVWFDRQL